MFILTALLEYTVEQVMGKMPNEITVYVIIINLELMPVNSYFCIDFNFFYSTDHENLLKIFTITKKQMI